MKGMRRSEPLIWARFGGLYTEEDAQALEEVEVRTARCGEVELVRIGHIRQ
jgi:hypothetical protein